MLHVSDPERLRAVILRLMPGRTRHGLVRPTMHLLRRAFVICLPLGLSPVLVVRVHAASARLHPGRDQAGPADPPDSPPGLTRDGDIVARDTRPEAPVTTVRAAPAGTVAP